MKDSKKNGVPVALAGLARTASGAAWPGVLAVGAGAALLGRLAERRTVPRWLAAVQALWSAFMLSRAMSWAEESWPSAGNSQWIGLILLAMAFWLVQKGKAAVQAASGILGMAQAGLLAAVLLGSVREIRISNLLPASGLPDGWLLTVLLMPGEGRHNGWLWALPFGLVAAGVGCGGENAFLEMSRSVSGIGPVRRLESLASAGLGLGFFLMMAQLLFQESPGDRFWSAALAAGLFWSGFRINGWAAALCAAAVWCFLPALCRKKKEIKDKSDV